MSSQSAHQIAGESVDIARSDLDRFLLRQQTRRVLAFDISPQMHEQCLNHTGIELRRGQAYQFMTCGDNRVRLPIRPVTGAVMWVNSTLSSAVRICALALSVAAVETLRSATRLR